MFSYRAFKKGLAIIIILLVTPSAFADNGFKKLATTDELRELSATYLPEGMVLPESGVGKYKMTTGGYPFLTDMVIIDLTHDLTNRPSYILYYSLWTGMVEEGVYKSGNTYSFKIITIDKHLPVIYTINLVFVEPGKLRINIFNVQGDLVYDGMKESILVKCQKISN